MKKNNIIIPSQTFASIATLMLIFSTALSQNPVVTGWYADPEAIIYDSAYWIFPTYSDEYHKQTFFDAFSSTDLVTWEKYPHVTNTSLVSWASFAMWAPSVIRANGKYYLFFSANDIQSDEDTGGIGVAVADGKGSVQFPLNRPIPFDLIRQIVEFRVHTLTSQVG